jgi:hypothetical protein
MPKKNRLNRGDAERGDTSRADSRLRTFCSEEWECSLRAGVARDREARVAAGLVAKNRSQWPSAEYMLPPDVDAPDLRRQPRC